MLFLSPLLSIRGTQIFINRETYCTNHALLDLPLCSRQRPLSGTCAIRHAMTSVATDRRRLLSTLSTWRNGEHTTTDNFIVIDAISLATSLVKRYCDFRRCTIRQYRVSRRSEVECLYVWWHSTISWRRSTLQRACKQSGSDRTAHSWWVRPDWVTPRQSQPGLEQHKYTTTSI